MVNTVPLSVSDVMEHCPVQLNLDPEAANKDGYGFTFANIPDAPVYREISHLAAWLVGYWEGKAAVAKASRIQMNGGK